MFNAYRIAIVLPRLQRPNEKNIWLQMYAKFPHNLFATPLQVSPKVGLITPHEQVDDAFHRFLPTLILGHQLRDPCQGSTAPWARFTFRL